MADDSKTALLDIANNGAMLNQALSELSASVQDLANITLPATNGGTGQKTLTANNVLLGNGTSGVQFVAPGSSGNVLTSDGTTWTSSALSSSSVSSITFGTTGLTPSTASTGAVTVDGKLNVKSGGTGLDSLTAYGVLCGGTTTTGAVQSLATGTSGQVLTSAGSSAVPVFQTLTQSQLSSAFNATGANNTAPFYVCRAWVNFDGTKDVNGNTSTSNTNRLLKGSGNVTSVLRNGAGIYTLTFTTAMPDANYAVSLCGPQYTTTNGTVFTYIYGSASVGTPATKTSTTLQVCWTVTNGTGYDPTDYSVLIFR